MAVFDIDKKAYDYSGLPQDFVELPPQVKKLMIQVASSFKLVSDYIIPMIEGHESGEISHTQTEFRLRAFVVAKVAMDKSIWRRLKPACDAVGADNPKIKVLRFLEELLALELRLSDFYFESFQREDTEICFRLQDWKNKSCA
jgi:hypothetical protein